ncbi:MAG: anthranilate phosphoribosyltransferase [Actinobacteria bacterium]|nr:anthranilate phosphoribosyltransferase [Actinomycetota bacterium]
MSQPTWPDVLSLLLTGTSLTADQSSWAMERVMLGEATPAQVGAFVVALRAKGESVDEIVGLVSTMRRFAESVEVDGSLVDTCGTGGDRAGTINVSTIAAFVVAGAGAKVAKHGNRAASSACGSADLLEELGVRIDLPAEGVARCIQEAGMGFLFAPIFHPAMRHAGGPRKELGVPTIFNFLGPLTNPAGARHQVIGVSDPSMAPKMVEVLARLGTVHALVVHGSDGLDEITTTGTTAVWELQGDEVKEWIIDPVEVGIRLADPTELKGGAPKENARIALEVLSGTQGAARDVVILNAAAGLMAADLAESLTHAVEHAAESIDSKNAMGVLERLIEVSNRQPPLSP